MSREGISFVAVDDLGDVLAYHDTVPSGFSFVTYSGKRRVKADGGAPASELNPTGRSGSPTKSYQYLLAEIVWAGTLSGGDVVRYLETSGSAASRFAFEVFRDTGDNYKFRVISIARRVFDGAEDEQTLGTGTIMKAAGGTPDEVEIRIETGGGRLKLEVDGTVDIDEAIPMAGHTAGYTVPDAMRIIRLLESGGGLSGAKPFYWFAPQLWDCDAPADRPGFPINEYSLFPDGDGTSEYGDETTCASADGGEDHWDEWQAGGSADDATTYNCGDNATTESEISTLTTKTITNVANAFSCVRTRRRASGDAKTVQTWTRIEDASANSQEVENSNIGDQSWRAERAYFLGPPDGGAWTQGKVDTWRAGVRHTDANSGEADDHWTALVALLVTCADDPGPAVLRRVMGQVI